MKAVQYNKYGNAEDLKYVERIRPKPKKRQVIIRVSYSSVNPIDWKLREGMMKYLLPLRFPVVPGFDVSGEIVEIGENVKKFKVGDWVFARIDSLSGGASAEYAVVGEKALAKIPKSLSVEEAAAYPLAALTALQALRDLGNIGPEKKVLVIGASGGVGHFAVQLSKAFDAHVTAVCSSANEKLLRELGADEVIDYTTQRDYSSGGPYDIILDLIVDTPYKAYSSMLTKNGRYVSSLPTPSILARMIFMPFYSKKRVHFVAMKAKGQDLDVIADLADKGAVYPIIDSIYPLEELSAAHQKSETGHARGKILVEICKECRPQA